MRFFFAPHRHGPPRRRVPQARLLRDTASASDERRLTRDLVFERLLHVPEGIQVLDLGLRAELAFANGPDRHVGVTPQAALFHVAIVDAYRHEDGAETAEELPRVCGRAKIRLRDDLE